MKNRVNHRIILPILVIAIMIASCNSFSDEEVIAYSGENLILDMVHHNPGEDYTKSKYLEPEVLAKWGYNGQVVNDYVQCAITYEDFDNTLFPEGSESQKWREEREEKIKNQIKKAKKAGIQVFYFTDFIVFPKSLIKKYNKEISDSKGDIDIHKKLTQKLVRLTLQEIFSRFPEIDGLVIRTGEVYSHNVPWHLGNNPILKGMKSHEIILNIMREEVCVKLNKKLIYRTWDFGLLHTNAKNYNKLNKMVKPHKNLIFSIKHTNGDFHRTELFNTTIGQGRHPQLIEVQCQREYEGKGAHPNYICDGVINGFEELDYLQEEGSLKSVGEFSSNKRYAGIWTWTRGGGWLGPYITDEFWCDLNSWVMANWAKDKTQSEEQVFNKFAIEFGFDKKNATILREMALLSADGVLRGRACTQGGINVWWTRDHYIGNPINMTPLALKEKTQAVEIWKKIETLSTQIKIDDKKLEEFIRVSSTYGRIKYQIFEVSWKITDLKRNAKNKSTEMKKLIEKYDTLWAEFRQLKEDFECCPTLYKDEAMGYKHNVGAFGVPGIGATVDSLR